MAQFIAEKMIEQQRHFRYLQDHGLPPELQRLIEQVSAGQIAYQGRDRDVTSLDGYLAEGNFSMAQFIAEKMIEQQRQFRYLQDRGLPEELQKLIEQVSAGQIAYQGRDRDVTSLNGYLAEGNFSMAQFIAEKMIEQQRQFRHLQDCGLPPELQRLIKQVNAEQIAYQGRDRDVTSLDGYLAEGNFSMAQFIAEKMIEQQRQFRYLQDHGLPHELQRLIEQVNAEQITYQGRDRDMTSLDGYLAEGNFSMAQFIAEKMIEQQGNIRTRIENAVRPDGQ
ncbi:hypothetical protein [Pseudomonas sp. KBW05]|uniref:hypothetical protein n=1 Tax=Pseudomonas sp. KBW05 TaxID=2153360 RepID=UPI000F59FE69|nr:hypothetical protein [Pseudomonas sp. KBW05]